jgi:hypothetical protein
MSIFLGLASGKKLNNYLAIPISIALLIAIVYMAYMAYTAYVLAMNKTLMHEYKNFKFAVPFEKIKHKDAILVLIFILFFETSFAFISGLVFGFIFGFILGFMRVYTLFLSNQTFLILFGLLCGVFIRAITFYLYINYWKKAKIIRLEKTGDSQS